MKSSNRDGLSVAPISDRLAELGGARWAVHFEARRRVAAGEPLIELTIGEPDLPTPEALIDVASNAMRTGRTKYTGGKGEPSMLQAVADKYSRRTGRDITPANVLAVPGTQAGLALTMMALVQEGDAVLVPDPYYATYEGVVRGTGADFVSVPMSADNGFHLTAEQLENAITPDAKVLLLNSPHNPTGAVLSAAELSAIGQVCRKHDLWIVSDEVYEALIYEGTFASLFDVPDLSDRVIAVSSISKSHAAPGFRCGWCVGPPWMIDRVQSVAENILFGGQPFLADMVTHALTHEDDVAQRMSANYQRRSDILSTAFQGCAALTALKPASGMFMLVDISATGLNGHEAAMALLDYGVAVMPGTSFGNQAQNFIRLSLTVPHDDLREAAKRIIAFAEKASFEVVESSASDNCKSG